MRWNASMLFQFEFDHNRCGQAHLEFRMSIESAAVLSLSLHVNLKDMALQATMRQGTCDSLYCSAPACSLLIQQQIKRAGARDAPTA